MYKRKIFFLLTLSFAVDSLCPPLSSFLFRYGVHIKAFINFLTSPDDLFFFLNFSFYVLLSFCFHARLPLSFSAAPSCAQDGGDCGIILSYIWLQMWGCNLQIPSLKKAGQCLAYLALVGDKWRGRGKIMREYRHACSVTLSPPSRRAGLVQLLISAQKRNFLLKSSSLSHCLHLNSFLLKHLN